MYTHIPTYCINQTYSEIMKTLCDIWGESIPREHEESRSDMMGR